MAATESAARITSITGQDMVLMVEGCRSLDVYPGDKYPAPADTDEILESCRVHQPWRPMDVNLWLVIVKHLDRVPFCYECADWHAPDEMHSTSYPG